MIVCIDSGNSRIKWGVHDGERWLAQDAVFHADVARLAELASRWPKPVCVMLANVAGEAAGERIRRVLEPWRPLFREARPQASGYGVTNLYKNPAQLGVDRWCALIGARALVGSATLVVMAGTATTIDALTADGSFLGGLILPGLALMRESLGRGTAGLPVAAGRHAIWPDCTTDAIQTGVLEAQAGAIERAWRRLPDEPKVCLIGGGNAEGIAGCLELPCRVTHNLPMEGLKEIARRQVAA